MFVTLKWSRLKAAFFALGIVLCAVFFFSSKFTAVSPVLYEELYPDMFVQTPTEFRKEEGKVAYYTFDDGPSKNTLVILDTLKKMNVKATFFVTGQDFDDVDSEAILKRIVEEGHAIGIHTYSHDFRNIYSSVENYLADFYKIRETIMKATGVEPKIFRYPGGSCENAYSDPKVQKNIRIEMRRRGYVYYDWNVVSGDDRSYMTDTSTLINNIVKRAGDEEKIIILCHDDPLRSSTAKAVEPVIEQLQQKGYRFEKLTEYVEPIQFTHHDYE